MDLTEKSEELRRLARAVMEGNTTFEEYRRQRREFIDFLTHEEGASFDGFEFSLSGDMDDTDVNENIELDNDDTMPTVMRGPQGEPAQEPEDSSSRIYSILIPLILGGGATVILLLFVVLWLLLKK